MASRKDLLYADLAVEHRPADIVSQPFIIQDQVSYSVWQLVELPLAFQVTGRIAHFFWD